MKILFLSFYYCPDLCAGSFRSTALIDKLKKVDGLEIEVITTLPNRYASYSSDALEREVDGNVVIHRIGLPNHKSGMLDQAKAFYHYHSCVNRLIKDRQYSAVYATSSRLFTAFLGARISSSRKIPLYLDIRDIFVDTIKDVLPPGLALLAKPIFSLVEQYSFARASRINLVSKGFESYFADRYPKPEYRWFTNGIDEVFINSLAESSGNPMSKAKVLTILYAGNIGEGQGLHNIVPDLASLLGGRVVFRLIGDGGRKQALLDSLQLKNVSNVEMLPPVNREALIDEYRNADVLFLHLNDYPAFEKVLPSKIFEYAAMGKPILAGVNGYSASFISSEVENSAVFYPGDADQAVKALEQLDLADSSRDDFITKFSRSSMMNKMADDIVEFLTEYGVGR